MKRQIKLSAYAKQMGVNYRTAQRWFTKGQIEGAYKDINGRIYVKTDENITSTKKCVIYARVSSHDQKDDLNRQINRLKDYASANGLVVEKIISEIGSGMNDKRRHLIKVLNDKTITTIIVEHKDRLTRFGFNYLELLLKRLNVELIIINKTTNDKEDIVEDFISVITSFCARIYGNRRGSRKSTKIKQILES